MQLQLGITACVVQSAPSRAYWHRPIVVRDMKSKLGEVIGRMKVAPERPGDDRPGSYSGVRRAATHHHRRPTSWAACGGILCRWKEKRRRRRAVALRKQEDSHDRQSYLRHCSGSRFRNFLFHSVSNCLAGIDLAKRRLDSSMILWRVSSMKIRGIANAKRVEERTLIRADHQIKPGLVPYCLPISANSSVRPS